MNSNGSNKHSFVAVQKVVYNSAQSFVDVQKVILNYQCFGDIQKLIYNNILLSL